MQLLCMARFVNMDSLYLLPCAAAALAKLNEAERDVVFSHLYVIPNRLFHMYHLRSAR